MAKETLRYFAKYKEPDTPFNELYQCLEQLGATDIIRIPSKKTIGFSTDSPETVEKIRELEKITEITCHIPYYKILKKHAPELIKKVKEIDEHCTEVNIHGASLYLLDYLTERKGIHTSETPGILEGLILNDEFVPKSLLACFKGEENPVSHASGILLNKNGEDSLVLHKVGYQYSFNITPLKLFFPNDIIKSYSLK